jgi:2-desacetyl-2-hydroxyethyl bacteriochlorophyllide A dehydrogenase
MTTRRTQPKRRQQENSMGYVLNVEAPRKVGLAEYEERPLAPGEVRLKTLYSGVSAGTELTLFRGSSPYLSKEWDASKRLFVSSNNVWNYPKPAMGYEEVGQVVEVGSGVEGVTVGDVVWGTWAHKSTHIATGDWVRQRLMPSGLDPVCGIFSQIGAIALNAVIDANLHLGETVGIFGQGAPGLMITQLAKASGVRVIAVDRLPRRVDMARDCGADIVLNGAEIDAPLRIKELTDGRGADVSIEITGHYGALHDAIRATAYNSRVVVSGFFQGEAHHLFLGEEFHHNRIDLVCSQIFGVNPSLDHRWNRLRLDQTVMRLQAEGRVDFKKLITHRFAAEDLQQAYDLLEGSPEGALQVVLEFNR